MIEEKIKAKFKKLVGSKIRSFKKIDSDFSNMIFNINDAYIVRYNLMLIDPLISFKVEKKINEILLDNDISEKIIYFNKIGGFKISKIIHGYKTFIEEPTKQNITSIVKAIKKIHSLKCTTNLSTFEFKNSIEIYKKSLNPNYFIDENIELEILTNILNIKEKLEKVLSHNNLLLSKIFIQYNNIKIIDYKFASINSPLFDLAFFSFSAKLNQDDDTFMLKKYFGHKYRLKYIKLLCIYKNYIALLLYYRYASYFAQTGETIYLLNIEKIKNYLNFIL